MSPQLRDRAGALRSSRHKRPLTAAAVRRAVQAMETTHLLEVFAPIAMRIRRLKDRVAPLWHMAWSSAAVREGLPEA
jgi:hypothetical protein